MEDEANPVGALSAYELRNLVEHLAQARRLDDLRRLLMLETGNGGNAWYERKLAGRQLDSYAADIAAALTAVQAAAFEAGEFRPRLDDQYRYALMLTSLNSLASRVPPLLLTALLRNELITTADALNYARRATEAIQRAEALLELLPALDDEQRSLTTAEIRREVEASAPSVSDHSQRYKLLAALVPYLSAADAAQVMDELIDGLAEEDRKRESAYRFGDALRPVAGRLSHEQARRLYQITSASSDELIRDDMLDVVAAGADYELLERVLADARELALGHRRVWVPLKLLERFPPAEREQVRTNAIEALVESPSLDGLAGIVELAPAAMRERIIETMIEMGRAPAVNLVERAGFTVAGRAIGLFRAAFLLSDRARRESLIGEAVAVVEAIPPEEIGSIFRHQLTELAEIAQQLPSAAQRRLHGAVLEAARASRDPTAVLAELSDFEQGAEREALLAEALDAFRTSHSVGQQSALRTLAPRLPPEMLLDAFRVVQVIDDDDGRREALAALTPYLLVKPTREQVAEAIAAAKDVHHAESGRDILLELARRLDAKRRAPVLAAALEFPGRAYSIFCDALELFAPSFDSVRAPGLRSVWERAVEVSLAIDEPIERARALTALAAAAPPSETVLKAAVEAAGEIEEQRWRAEAFARLAPLHDEPERTHLAGEALAAARLALEQGHPGERLWGGRYGITVNLLAATVASLGPDRAGALAKQVLEIARHDISDYLGRERADAIATIADCYPEPRRSRLRTVAVAVARDAELGNEELILRVAPASLRAQALTDALAHARRLDGYTIWRQLSSMLLDLEAVDAYTLVAYAASDLTTPPRTRVLDEIERLAPLIDKIAGAGAVAGIAAAIADCGRWWP